MADRLRALAGPRPRSWPGSCLFAMRGLQGPMLLIALFGEQTYGVPLGDQRLPQETVWLLHVRDRNYETISADDFYARVISEMSA